MVCKLASNALDKLHRSHKHTSIWVCVLGIPFLLTLLSCQNVLPLLWYSQFSNSFISGYGMVWVFKLNFGPSTLEKCCESLADLAKVHERLSRGQRTAFLSTWGISLIPKVSCLLPQQSSILWSLPGVGFSFCRRDKFGLHPIWQEPQKPIEMKSDSKRKNLKSMLNTNYSAADLVKKAIWWGRNVEEQSSCKEMWTVSCSTAIGLVVPTCGLKLWKIARSPKVLRSTQEVNLEDKLRQRYPNENNCQ